MLQTKKTNKHKKPRCPKKHTDMAIQKSFQASQGGGHAGDGISAKT